MARKKIRIALGDWLKRWVANFGRNDKTLENFRDIAYIPQGYQNVDIIFLISTNLNSFNSQLKIIPYILPFNTFFKKLTSCELYLPTVFTVIFIFLVFFW